MKISPSQLQSFTTCPRQWWWRNVRRMPTPGGKSRALTFGTVFHGVCERYLKADDRGIDPATGQPVNLYPPGWETAVERDGSKEVLGFEDREMVRRLITDAVQRGVLRRLPGRRVEERFETWVAPDVVMVGVMDQRNHEVVEDHKTPGRRSYAQGSEKLGADLKMRCYAVQQMRDFPEESKQGVRLRLNQACKDPKEDPPTWATEAVVPVDELQRFWDEEILPVVGDMVDLAQRDLSDDDWSTVEGPRKSNACREYDGCPFQAVCSGTCSPATMRQRAEPKKRPRSETAGDRPAGDHPMFKKVPGAAPSTPPALPTTPPAEAKVDSSPQVPTSPTPAPTIETPPPAPAGPTPPWARPDCPACKGTGINGKGVPCVACDRYNETRKTGRPQSKDVKYWHDEKTGKLCWEATTATVGTPNMTEQKTGQTEDYKEIYRRELAACGPAVPLGTADPKTTEATPEATPEVPAVVPTGTAEAPAKKSRKATPATPAMAPEAMKAAALAVAQPGFVLYINSMPLGQDYVDLLDILHREGADLAREKGAPSFYDMDSFKRRDMLAAEIGKVAREFEGKNVVAMGSGQDLKHYAEALRPLARFVVVPVF